jgi:hypothetical protein
LTGRRNIQGFVGNAVQPLVILPVPSRTVSFMAGNIVPTANIAIGLSPLSVFTKYYHGNLLNSAESLNLDQFMHFLQ